MQYTLFDMDIFSESLLKFYVYVHLVQWLVFVSFMCLIGTYSAKAKAKLGGGASTLQASCELQVEQSKPEERVVRLFALYEKLS